MSLKMATIYQCHEYLIQNCIKDKGETEDKSVTREQQIEVSTFYWTNVITFSFTDIPMAI